MASLKKKRVSKKLKVSWRKHVKIDDVEEYLEDIRLEERLGPISTIADNELFKLDTKPREEVISVKERRKLRSDKPLKCFSSLQAHTKVPDPISKRNRVKTKEEKKNDLIKQKEQRNRLNGILKQKEIQSLQDQKLYELKVKSKNKRGEFNSDIWAEDKINKIELNEWASTSTKKHNLKGIGKAQKNTAKSVTEKKSLLPPIEVPHPGMSYNPSFEDHQDLLKIVADKETEFIKRDAYLTRVTRGMFNKVSPAVRDQSWIVEMSEGLPSKDDQTVAENETSDNEYKAVNPPVKNTKKTVKQRRKQKEQKELARQRNAVKLEKRKVTAIHQVKLLKKQIEKSDKKQAVLRDMRKRRAERKALEPKRLSSTKFEEPGLEFNLGSDISGNLRNVKKEGSLLRDRFKNMQKRNILEPSVKRVRKNAKVKRYTKSGHKEDWKKTVAR